MFEEKRKQMVRPSALSTLEALALLVIGLLFAQGARAQKITMEFDQSIDFSRYKASCDPRRPVERRKSPP